MKSMSISRELLPASLGHPGLFLLPGWTLMHMDVPPPQLGQLDLPVGVTIQYLSLKGFFHSCSQKVSYFGRQKNCVSEVLIVVACFSNQFIGHHVSKNLWPC